MDENNYVRAIHIVEGQKIWMPNKAGCYELEKKLNSIGIETRVGNTCGTNLWSIYIISIPDILVDTYREFEEVKYNDCSERFDCVGRRS